MLWVISIKNVHPKISIYGNAYNLRLGPDLHPLTRLIATELANLANIGS